jgi:hypothetical protein
VTTLDRHPCAIECRSASKQQAAAIEPCAPAIAPIYGSAIEHILDRLYSILTQAHLRAVCEFLVLVLVFISILIFLLFFYFY